LSIAKRGRLAFVAIDRWTLDPGYPLIRYLGGKNKLDDRTRLAAKLVVMPALLTFEETEVLRNQYGMNGGFAQRRKVKEVAQALGYPNAAVLSRKLYRVRGWAAAAPPIKESASTVLKRRRKEMGYE
jgi:hypothetical protein